MRKYRHKFAGRNSFMLFANFVQYALEDIEANIANILQLRLLRHILGDCYEKKILPKVIHKPDKYRIELNDAQAVAVALALNNHRSEFLPEVENIILDGILSELMRHLERNPEPIEYPQLPTPKN